MNFEVILKTLSSRLSFEVLFSVIPIKSASFLFTVVATVSFSVGVKLGRFSDKELNSLLKGSDSWLRAQSKIYRMCLAFKRTCVPHSKLDVCWGVLISWKLKSQTYIFCYKFSLGGVGPIKAVQMVKGLICSV